MTKNNRPHNGIALLRNVMSMATLVQRVVDRTATLPGMAVFYGPSGYGKTQAATYAANIYNAYYIEVRSRWTARDFCEAILKEMGVPPQRGIARMLAQIAKEMASTGRPLFVDEADFLIKRNLVELVRDIYESSDGAVILIGEENLPTELSRWERIHGRMLDWIAAEPAVIDDVMHLEPYYCPDVEIEDALRDYLLEESRYSIRRICVNLDMLLEHSRTSGETRITKKGWIASGKTFFSGKAPRARGLQ